MATGNPVRGRHGGGGGVKRGHGKHHGKGKHSHGPKQKIYKQPPFDKRLRLNVSRPFGYGYEGGGRTLINRGFLQWDVNQTPPAGYQKKDPNWPATVYFLFNPSTISTSYQMADGGAQAALNYPGATSGSLNGALLVPLQQQTAFTIMFDRTYELNDPQITNSHREVDQNIANYGVDVDIAALRQYTGMYANEYNGNFQYNPFQTNANQAPTGNTKNGGTVNNQAETFGHLAQGIMQLTLGYVLFSGDGDTGISYYGYIDSWDVEYTHFTSNMVPMRAVVDISFSFLPPPGKPNKKGAAAEAASQAAARKLQTSLLVLGNTNKEHGIAGR